MWKTIQLSKPHSARRLKERQDDAARRILLQGTFVTHARWENRTKEQAQAGFRRVHVHRGWPPLPRWLPDPAPAKPQPPHSSDDADNNERDYTALDEMMCCVKRVTLVGGAET